MAAEHVPQYAFNAKTDFATDVSRHIWGPHLPEELRPLYRWFGSITSPGGYWPDDSPDCNISMPEYALKTKKEWESVKKSMKKAMKVPAISNQAVLGEYLDAISAETFLLKARQ